MKRQNQKRYMLATTYMGLGTRFSPAELRVCGAAGGAGPGRMARYAISIEPAPRQEAAATAADA